MKSNSRTVNSIYNFISGIGGQLITIVMQFIVRSVFINTLGKEYLGIGGLFSNILSMLSLAEFGVGSAILFKLYEPLAKDDRYRISLLMKLYKQVYRGIGGIVAVAGVCLMPFLPVLIADYDSLAELNINAIFIFMLYLFNSVSSYLFFAYKSAIIRASQKEYILNIISYVFTVGTGLLQIVFLWCFPNFELYVLISILQGIGQNIIGAKIADKMYPYINEKIEGKIRFEEVKGLIKDCSALFLYKLNRVVVKSTDNIVLSSFLGLGAVGIYSNYYIFYTSIYSLVNKVFSSVAHSIGNLHTDGNTKHEYKIFEVMMLISAILGGTAFVGVFCVADELITVWIGNEWRIEQPFAFLLGIELFTMTFKTVLGKYRTAMGLFQQAKFRPLATMSINLILSVLLVNVWGITGVLVGTIAADWLTFMWYDPMIIHKHGFKNIYNVSRYYVKFLKYFLIACMVGVIDWYICNNFMTGLGWISLIVHIVICGLTMPCTVVLVNIKSPEGQYVYSMVQSFIVKIAKKMHMCK